MCVCEALSCKSSCKLYGFEVSFPTVAAIVISLNKTALGRFEESFYKG